MEKEGAASRLSALSYADVLATAKAKLVELQANPVRAIAKSGDEDTQQARIISACCCASSSDMQRQRGLTTFCVVAVAKCGVDFCASWRAMFEA